jgi:beta-lactamase regulating signal transducer with metallopeptidase domain
MTTPETIRVLGWCLLHFVWQGALIALVLCALLSRLHNPRARYASAVSALTAMLIVPFFTFAILKQSPEPIRQFSMGALTEIGNGLQAVQSIAAPSDIPAGSPFVPRTVSIDWMGYAVLAWFVGVYVFTLRTLGGLMLLMRLRRQLAEPIAGDLLKTCLALQQRLGVSRAVRYVCSKASESPAAFGWLRPVIVLPLSALAGLSPWQIEAILAHELAHIKRWDSVVNAFQIVTETLLFYHPAVWWVNRVIRNEREHCCDDIAVEACGNAYDYARTLAQLEESRSTSVWAMAANGGVLTSRIGRLLGLKRAARNISVAGIAVIVALCVGGVLLAGTTVAQLQSSASAAPATPVVAPLSAVPMMSATPMVTAPMVSAAMVSHVHVSPLALTVSSVHLAQLEAGAAVRHRTKEAASQDSPTEQHGSYIEGLQSAGLKDLTVDEIIALKIHGVTPDYIRGLRAAGIEASSPELVSLKIHEITPEYVRSLAAAGVSNLHVHEYLAAKIQGITPEFIQGIRSHGFKDLTLRQLIALKMADIS